MIETDYFGGVGEQCAVVYEGTATLMDPMQGNVGPINNALRLLGFRAGGGRDEFETAGLGGGGISRISSRRTTLPRGTPNFELQPTAAGAMMSRRG